MKARLIAGLTTTVFLLAGGTTVAAQEIPRDEYLKHVPLQYPKLIRQTPASDTLHLFGDKAAPGYTDISPKNGIDDGRDALLHALGVRFAPFVVMNTTAIPMDFRKFIDQGNTFPLTIHNWNIGVRPNELLSESSIDWVGLGSQPCEVSGPGVRIGAPSRGDSNDDCKLLELLREFHPENPTVEAYQRVARPTDYESFKVMFFNFPGDSPESWKREYTDPVSDNLPTKYRQEYPKVYVHPFINELKSNNQGVVGYEFVLQYWLFYPWNDGGNDHEGDWEHINVVISPRSAVERSLQAEDIRRILARGPGRLAGEDPLVIRRVDFYFHHQVMMYDYSSPNVYLPRDEWERVTKDQELERVSQDFFWKTTRRWAYWDEAETEINTHPIVYVGADNKGLDQLLAAPGGRNRDSHGSYPLTGLYKDVGPGGSTEQIRGFWDHRKYWADTTAGLPDKVERYDLADRIELVPDWERVIDEVHTDPEMRREWAWLVLPIRWGWPASVSPFSGLVDHASMGNLAPFGPTWQSSWNTSGASAGFHHYDPHKFSSLFPLGYQDTFNNSFGFINGITSTLLILPPIDLAWRVIAAPFKAIIKKPVPVFFPTENVPFRFLGISGGAALSHLPEDYNELILDETILVPLVDRLVTIAPTDTGFVDVNEPINESSIDFIGGVSLYLGKRLVSSNTLRHARHDLGFDLLVLPSSRVFQTRAELNMWEYAGSLRYNLAVDKLQPYFKLGYGLSWYRLENVTTQLVGTDPNPVPLDPADGQWVRKPWANPDGSTNAFANILPNTWHVGAGIELIPISSIAPIPRGIEVSLQLDWSWHHHKLGLQTLIPDFVSLEGGNRETNISRHVLALYGVLGF